MIGVFLSLFLTGISWAWKLIKFTGAWISVLLLLLIDELLLGMVFQVHINVVDYPTIYPIYEAGIIILMLVPIVLTLAYRGYRLIHPKEEAPPPVPQAPQTPEERAASEETSRQIQAMAAELLQRREEEKR